MQTIHVLETKPLVQKFFKPNSKDFILFLDDSVKCPFSRNPHLTDKGRISVSAVCFDCTSFIGFSYDQDKKSIFCEGLFELLNTKKTNVRDYLENIEQSEESFWIK